MTLRTPRPSLSPFAFALLAIGASACAGSHKHAEVPDFTEKGWSEPSPELTQAKADPTIQSAQVPAAPVKSDQTSTAAADTSPAPAASKPEASMSAGADAATMPFPPPPKIAKPKSKKKNGKRKSSG